MKSLILFLLCALGCEGQMLWFEPNRGQAHPSVKALARTRAGYVYFGRNQVAVGDVRMELVNSNARSKPQLEEPDGAISSYFIGQNEADWKTGIPHYGRVRFRNVYPGIDIIYYGNQRDLEYDFVVRPGANPRLIQLAFNKPVRMDERGDLLIAGLKQRRPKVFQDGREIACDYIVRGPDRVQFALAKYDPALALTVDPVLDFSTYIGGPGEDDIADIKVDSSGFVYLGGASQTPQAPTLNPFQQSNIVTLAPFVLKFTGDGQHVVYYAVIGGINGWDEADGVVVDANGSPTMVGRTRSSDFPLKNAFQTTFKATWDNAFITKLTPDGRSLVFSTYFGGSNWEYPMGGGAIDSAGNIWLTGYTESQDFPVKNPIQTHLNGHSDCFIAKFSSAGALLFATYWGGSALDNGLGIAVDGNDNVVIAGFSGSTDFPLHNAVQNAGTPRTGFGAPTLVKLSPDGQSIVFSTYLGNASTGAAFGIGFDAVGNIYVAGEADDPSLVTTPGALQSSSGGNSDAFLIELDASASKVLYTTYLGGSANDSGRDVKVDANGYIYLLGYTDSADFPVKNPLQKFRGGGPFNQDLFVAKLTPGGSSIVYSTPFGGSGNELPGRLALTSFNALYVTGTTSSTDFPVQNAFQPTYGGGQDGIFARISDSTPIQPSPLTAAPAILQFRYVQGSPSPSPQTVTVSGGSFIGTPSADWLVAANQPGSVSVSVNPTNLAPGTYAASLILTPASGTPATVSVTLAVFAPAPVLTSIDPPLIPVGSNDTTVTLHGSGFTPNSAVLVDGILWSATPIQYIDGSTLKFSVPANELNVSYNHPVTVQNPQSALSAAVLMSVGVPPPNFTAASVVNAGSFGGGPIAPGEIVTIFGTNLAGNVTFDNIPATIVYTSATQISATVPYTVRGPQTSLQVGFSLPVSLDVALSAPGIFAAVANGNGTLTLYATGCGALTQDALPLCQLPVSATINGEPVEVLYAGIAPGLVQGANQVNLVLPSDIASGPIMIVLTEGSVLSKPFPYTLP
jgi:uncharacterized protein (TIGR03437 family)